MQFQPIRNAIAKNDKICILRIFQDDSDNTDVDYCHIDNEKQIVDTIKKEFENGEKYSTEILFNEIGAHTAEIRVCVKTWHYEHTCTFKIFGMLTEKMHKRLTKVFGNDDE